MKSHEEIMDTFYLSLSSVEFRIVSRLTVEPIFKHQLEQWLHSDAADRLHLRCCGSQKITEVRCALLGSDRS